MGKDAGVSIIGLAIKRAIWAADARAAGDDDAAAEHTKKAAGLTRLAAYEHNERLFILADELAAD